jgi:superfamily I DNA/RNA helicase/Zn-dependent peptidase ImmA (M78 family)
MPDWTPLRRRARAHFERLRAHLPDDGLPLPTAEAILEAAAAETGLARQPLPPGDSLLAGAHAVLDRDMGCIWYAQDDTIPRTRQRFAQAHEFAHYWLHPGPCHCQPDDSLDTLFIDPTSLSFQIAQGYSPAERREKEANLFAAELVLPAPLLRRAYREYGWDAARIAAYVGVSEACALSQLCEALLLPEEAPLPAPPPKNRGRESDTTSSSPASNSRQSAEERQSRHTDGSLPLFLGGGAGRGAASPGRGLNASQRAAAEIERGPVLVDAGPGTGKTHTLVSRVLYLLQERQVAPENILALTFSNKAAEEMRARLAEAVPDQADRLWIGTFHSFGMEMLRKDGGRLGLPLTPVLVETADAIVLLEQHLDRLPLNEFAYLHDPTLPFPAMLRCLSRAKDELKTPDDYMAAAAMQYQTAQNDEQRRAALKSAEIAQFYAVYQRLLAENGLLDFGDLLMRPVELLDACPDVLARWQAQFPHILADEYQDINRASAQLVRRLAGEGQGLWAVGDLRQAIYRFRGASPANVREFETDFPGGRRLQLDTNYRSRPSLVSLFSAVAAQMPAAPGDKEAADFRAWLSQREDEGHPTVTLAVAADEEAQADGLAQQIREWEARGVSLREQAILCRTNGQATDLSERLEARGVPTLHLGDLFDRPEIKDMLSLVALACGPTGRELARVAQFAEYQIPPEDVARLLDAAKQAGSAFPGALTLAADLPDLSTAGREGLRRLRAHLEPLLYRGNAWMLLARYLFETSGYLRPLLATDTIANRQKRLALYQLLTFVQDCSKKLEQVVTDSPHRALLDHIRRLRACGEDNVRLPASADALEGVRLMTVHASKGLEFPVVYLPNLVKGQFPPRGQAAMATPPPNLLSEVEPDEAAQASGKEEEAEGELCLFFVALSRARDHLVLCRPETWRGNAIQPSPLLAQIEPMLTACGAQQVRWEALIPVQTPPQPSPSPGEGASRRSPSPSQRESVREPSPPPYEGESQQLAPPLYEGGGRGEVPGGRADKPEVSLSALEQYQRCPRQFYYQRIVKLPAQEIDSTYLVFHDCVQEMTRWVKAEQAAGRTPTEEEKAARLDALWAERFPEANAQTRLLRREAEKLLENLRAYVPASTPEAAHSQHDMELVADLPNGRVRLTCDHAESLPDGTLRLGRYMKGRAKKDDHTAPRLALMRHAARQQDPDRPVEITLYYLNDGQQREVPETARYEPARVAKYDEALRGIRLGDFPPAPDDRKCAQCPYFFLCPL